MASISEIKEALKRTIKDNIDMQLTVYDNVDDMVDTPCIIIEPEDSDFNVVMQRGQDEWDYKIYVITSRAGGTVGAQKQLDKLVDGSGPNSIREAIYTHSDLGLPEDEGVDATVTGMRGYGGSFQFAKIPHVGAILHVHVLTDGRH